MQIIYVIFKFMLFCHSGFYSLHTVAEEQAAAPPESYTKLMLDIAHEKE